MDRRKFLALSATAASYSRILGANDRVQVGFIGYGLIGAQHVFDFKNQKDVDMAALCDVYEPRLEQGIAACGGKAKSYHDFRKMLDDKDLNAIVVSTPDHWHALITMMACAAGKDVYVEKPMTLFIDEGKWMTKVARKHNRIVQVGTQQRSGTHYQHARELVQQKYFGKIVSARMGSFRNILPGFGAPANEATPGNFDYNMWLGPAPERAYNPKRGIYHFRWFWDYSGGQMTNLAAHEIDILQWFTGVDGPLAVTSTGGRFGLDPSQDNGETPDVQDALLEYPGWTALWSHREVSAGMRGPRGMEIFGTKGSLLISRAGYEVTADMKVDPTNSIPVFKGHPGGGPQRSVFQPEPWIQAKKEPGSSDQQFDSHVRNFLDCVKSRKTPIADVSEGHRTAVTCHLANISLRLGRKVHWDPAKQEITGDRQAAGMMTRPYRAPWDGILRSLLA